jgi:hypothetical protein
MEKTKNICKGKITHEIPLKMNGNLMNMVALSTT